MSEIISFGLVCFTSFFTLINPIGVMPVFMSMTGELTDAERKKTARKAIIVAFFSIVFFALTGQVLFKFFGISADSFRVVGGVIFFMMGMDMLQARLSKVKLNDSEAKVNYITDISITPLAIPMICGPGAITNSIVLMEDANTIGLKVALFVAIAVTLSLTYLILFSSSRIIKLLGKTGNNVLMRIMGLIVMVIAVEFFFSGMRPILRGIFNL